MAQAEAQFVYRLQTVGGFGGKCDQLNAYNVYLGEPDFFARDLGGPLPRPSRLGGGDALPCVSAARRRQRRTEGRNVWRLPTRCLPLSTDVPDRTRLPALAADAPFTFPAIRKTSLPNGLAIWTVQHRTIPVQTMVLLVRVGSSEDPDDRPGLASLTGDMLDEGAGDHGALELNEALARLGAQFDTEVGPDATFLTLTTLSRFRRRAFELMADIVARPQFSGHEFDRVRQLRANRLRQLRDVPSAVADCTFASALYGSHRYGHLAIGTMSALEAMTLPEVVAFHQRQFAPSRAVLVVVGDAPHDDIVAAAEEAFSGWTETASGGPPSNAAARVLQPPADPSSRLVLVDRPGAAQSELRIGHLGVSRRTPDYHALLLMNLVLGGQFVSRLNMNLREHKGFTYGARSWFEFRLGPGPFQMSASVQTEVSADAIREALEEVRTMHGDRPVTSDELDVARASLTRGYPRNFETADQVARSVAQLALYELPDDYFAVFVPRINALELETVRAAAERHLDADRLLTVIVGDRTKVLPALSVPGWANRRWSRPRSPRRNLAQPESVFPESNRPLLWSGRLPSCTWPAGVRACSGQSPCWRRCLPARRSGCC